MLAQSVPTDFVILQQIYSVELVIVWYSGVPITRAGCIKQAGRNFYDIHQNEQALLSKQAGIFMMILKTSRHYYARREDYFLNFLSKIGMNSYRIDNNPHVLLSKCLQQVLFL